MTRTLIDKFAPGADLKSIVETVSKILGEDANASVCQVVLTNPLEPNLVSIYEYKASSWASGGTTPYAADIPLTLGDKKLGHVSLHRESPFSAAEISQLGESIADLGAILRRAQITEVVQRQTFRNTFLTEIDNVMSYSLGIGDALFMVVSILGKVLHASRCVSICTDDSQAGWKCYEYWEQGKVQSCQDYQWPNADSALVVRTLLSDCPVFVYEGQSNSHSTPVREELHFIDTRSFVGVPLRSDTGVHGCITLMQCDYRRVWTPSDIDMLQSVADKVASSVAKFPSEKLDRESIMQLNQRTGAIHKDETSGKKLDSIRRALKGAFAEQAIPSASKTTAATSALGAVAAVSPVKDLQAAAPPLSTSAETQPKPVPPPIPGKPAHDGGHTIQQPVPPKPASSKWGDLQAIPTPSTTPAGGLSGSMLGIVRRADTTDAHAFVSPPKEKEQLPEKNQGKENDQAKEKERAKKKEHAKEKEQVQEFAAAAKAAEDELAKLMKEHSSQEQQAKPTEAKAGTNIEEILSAPNPTSDYIFATRGLNVRTLGRVDGWVRQIEASDKYADGHAVPVAKYAVAIAEQIGLPQLEIETIRLAALVHDVGKMGIASHILQKEDKELTDSELLICMKHALDGAELLESFPELAHVASIVRSHHEEYDGNGYPMGLNGEAIPVAARIIFVANAYHAMTSPRKSRPAPMSAKAAQQELQNGMRKQYDPLFVQALLAAIEQKLVPEVD